MTYKQTRKIYSIIGITTGVLLVILPGWLKVLAVVFYLAFYAGIPVQGLYERRERGQDPETLP